MTASGVSWLVHVAGEADLGLPATGDERLRHTRIEERRRAVAKASAAELSKLLATFDWRDGHPSEQRLAPLAVALDDLRGAVKLILVGTRTGHSLDSIAAAKTIEDALGRCPDLYGRPIGNVTVVEATSLAEDEVLVKVRDAIKANEGDEAYVTWGSGATSLVLGALAGVIDAGLRWRLVELGANGAQRPLDPHKGLELDPLVPWLLRWRYPDRLAELARDGRLCPPLTAEQRAAVNELADRRRDGLRSANLPAVASLVGDAIVRRDGTAGLALRRYIELRYEQLRQQDLRRYPKLRDLLEWASKQGCDTLGEQLDRIRRGVQGELRPYPDARSTRWLRGDDVRALNEAGSRLHRLRPPTDRQLQAMRRELHNHQDRLRDNLPTCGLPRMPALPTRQVLAVWNVGTGNKPPLGRDLVANGLGEEITGYLDASPQEISLRCLLLGTTGDDAERSGGASLPSADEQARVLTRRAAEAFASVTAEAAGITLEQQLDDGDVADYHAQVTELLTAREQELEDVAAVVLAPTGAKPIMLGTFLALHRWCLQRGVPLFLRSTVQPPDGPRDLRYHRLPARLAGDAVLAELAGHAIERLEYDVAARLLGSGSPELRKMSEECAALGRAFRCDKPDMRTGWPGKPVPADKQKRGPGLAADRVRLCRERLDRPQVDEGERIRLLLLAYCAVEASLSNVSKEEKTAWDQALHRGNRGRTDLARLGDTDDAWRVARTVRRVRNKLPLTHGSPNADLKRLVREAAAAERVSDSTSRAISVERLLDAFGQALQFPLAASWSDARGQQADRLLALDRRLRERLHRFTAERS